MGRGSLCWFRHAHYVGFAELVLPCWIVGRGSQICGSWLLGSWVTNLHEFVGRGYWVRGSPIYMNSWVAAAGFVGHQCLVRGSPIYTNSWVAVARFGEGDERDERQGWEMRDRGERVRDEGKNKGERVDKILFFFYNTCYSAILCLELHHSSIAKKFTILLFTILRCRRF